MSTMFIKDYLYIIIYNLAFNESDILHLCNIKMWSFICFINWKIIRTKKRIFSYFLFSQEIAFSNWEFIDDSSIRNKEFASIIAFKFKGLQALYNFQFWDMKRLVFKNMLDEVTITASKVSLVVTFIKII